MSETVGVRLRRLRTERGLTQRDLETPGVSYAYISRIESGTRTPSVKALRKLARKLGVTVEYLETGDERIAVMLTRESARQVAWLLRSTGDAIAVVFEAALTEHITKHGDAPDG